MAKELYSQKVEQDTKENLNRLTEKYKEQGLISENGDLLNLAADLLERNLYVQAPRHVVGIEELDQLTSRINRLFRGMIEQNNSSMETLRFEFEEKYENAKLTVDSLLGEKQELKEQLTNLDTKIKELTKLTEDNQVEINDLNNEILKNNKYIALLESKNEEKDNRIKQLEKFEKQNQELSLDSQQKSEEIQNLLSRITQLDTAAEQQKQAHQNEIRELQFQQREALFNKEKELNEQYNKEINQIRQQQSEYIDRFNERIDSVQAKYNDALAEKERIQALYEALKQQQNRSPKNKSNNPGGNK
jgi:chromosome segregation ATPase